MCVQSFMAIARAVLRAHAEFYKFTWAHLQVGTRQIKLFLKKFLELMILYTVGCRILRFIQ